ncbi:hypothetical protein L208DRAFT_1375397 [Tricholoma matsutake]|nr:hypothetical protein L208DRAFT_1375397 [Tricholoma matsutake 945]
MALSSDGCIIPSASNLSSNFFLVSSHHLQAAYNSWLKPSLIKEGYNPVGWDLALMHRNLRGLNLKAFIKKQPGVMHPCLQLILELTSKLKNTNNKLQCNIFWPPVEGQSKVARKDGASQKDGDETGYVCLLPTNRKKNRKKEKKKDPTTKSKVYYTPEELGLKKIAHRPEVFACCGRDVVLLIEINEKKLVGGVQFKPCAQVILVELIHHHEGTSQFKPLKRGTSFEAWKYGEMKALGSWLAQGGRAGMHTQCMQGWETADASTIMWTVFSIDQETAEESGLNHLGTTDYISPQHTNNDVDISVCMQFEKNCLSDKFNFSYTEWGVYIETIENCLWLFYSSHLHGTIIPHLSTLKAKNAHGDQETGHTSGSDISQSNAEQSIARRRRRHYSTGDHVTKRR